MRSELPENTPAAVPSPLESAIACFVMIARFHGQAVEPAQVAHESVDPVKGFGKAEILLAARKLGLIAKVARPQPIRLSSASLPAIAQDSDGRMFIVARCDSSESPDSKVLIHDPAAGRPQLITIAELAARWTGDLILFASRASISGDLARFDFSWFIPAVVKYRRILGEVLVASVVLQLLSLVTPLFFQVVMDKVLVNRTFSTLDVIAVAFLFASVFEVTLAGLRSYLLAHTSSRIDVELGARLFKHLLGLPLAYFQSRRVGDSVARVRELENIRQFLTGNALSVMLDFIFSIIFIAVMLYYSAELTLIVVASLPCYFLLSVLVTPVLRARLNEKFNRGADNQSFLVETVSGVDTVKAMAAEPHWFRKWDAQLASYVQAGFRSTKLLVVAGNAVNLIGKLVTVGTLWFGAKLVIEGKLTIGQLIAFNMLAGHVASPIIRLAQLWADFQQVGISMQRLGDILNTRTELSTGKSTMPRLEGRIEFDQTVFRYAPHTPEVLRGISLAIQPGQTVGIVGRSGSGKSTLVKLVQRLYVPERGRVLVDGVDIALAESASLRRQLGVVLQENILFNRSIRENIALTNPGAPLAQVIRVSQLAGAHEFISELPDGYDTMVGEHGASLSGGQRQRVALARALLPNPRILILDEATSALDYESERIIQANMKEICRGRTVLIIAHRLSAVRHADRIIVMERGQIVEEGRHDELLQRTDGSYSRLFRAQEM